MRRELETLARELDGGRGVVLARIVERSGSAPRGVGAAMLVLADGTALGTIGGGAVEYAAGKFALEVLADGCTRERDYDLIPGGDRDIGMICGGHVRVQFLYVAPGDPSARAQAEAALRAQQYAGTVYLFGAGHVSRALAKILGMTEFRYVVYDQRQEAVVREEFPGAEALYCGPYEDAMETVGPLGEEDYVVVMTPGHQADYEVLAQILRTPARYIGCIGSRRKAAAVRERLLAAGSSEADVDRIHSPIGLNIGETPAEIAVSVAAEIIAVRSGKIN